MNSDLIEAIIRIVASLALIVGLIYATLYLLRMNMRLRDGRYAGYSKKRFMQISESISLGANRSLHIVKVGGKCLVIGSTPTNISLITELDGESLGLDGTGEQPPAKLNGQVLEQRQMQLWEQAQEQAQDHGREILRDKAFDQDGELPQDQGLDREPSMKPPALDEPLRQIKQAGKRLLRLGVSWGVSAAEWFGRQWPRISEGADRIRIRTVDLLKLLKARMAGGWSGFRKVLSDWRLSMEARLPELREAFAGFSKKIKGLAGVFRGMGAKAKDAAEAVTEAGTETAAAGEDAKARAEAAVKKDAEAKAGIEEEAAAEDDRIESVKIGFEKRMEDRIERLRVIGERWKNSSRRKPADNGRSFQSILNEKALELEKSDGER